MANLLKISGSASALLALAALLAAGASADYVTTAECQARGRLLRVRRHPTDSEATYLAMHFCGLTEINQGYQDTFKGLPNLETIDLEGNHIENINPAAFHTVPTLRTLWLRRNKLHELPVFVERSCLNLTELSLFHNQLTGIENERTFSACVKLKNLLLGFNHIEFIHPGAFRPLIELKVLYLNDNNIRFMQAQMFASNGKLERLYLSNNRITHLPPNFASSLKRASVGLKLFYFYGNPWQCTCLLELLADVQRAGVTDYKRGSLKLYTRYAGTQPECTYKLTSVCTRAADTRTAGDIY